MSQRLRHRLVMFMIAVMAIIAFARAGVMDNTMGSMAGMQMCHGAGMPMAMQPGEPSAGHRPADGAMPDHACCKVCVCHPGLSALPPGFHACVLPAAARAIETVAARVVAAAGVFSTKSSPRGPPAHV
ncbi:DUF2946 family protein [Duganella callida]|uniref:DUF2946 domain-containing protein n=1 Tax=Duganella callida TaxID=2561932 RepID=A0A4Y9SHY8_9BURK|nr:DUF2946 family protein [Duganella callida]TFW21430.1 DUF2946 domain-containing protein [Duganella callida]